MLVITLVVAVFIMVIGFQFADDPPHSNHEPQRNDEGKDNENDGSRRNINLPFTNFLTMTRLNAEITQFDTKRVRKASSDNFPRHIQIAGNFPLYRPAALSDCYAV